MFDCDAYQSTKEALAFVALLIREHAGFLFDDWFSRGRAQRNLGQKLALDEFLSANPQLKVSDFGAYNENSHVVTVERMHSDPARA